MNIKVCHITSVHDRYDVRILKKECVSLSNHGFDVTLLVNDFKEDEVIDKVKICSTRYMPKNRIIRVLFSNRNMYKLAKKVDADIYHFHDPELLAVGNKLKKLNKIVIFDSHEDVPSQIYDKYWIPVRLRNIVSIVYEHYEKYVSKKLDAIISVTPKVVERFLKINKNTLLITNYPIVYKLCNNENLQVNDEKAICFAGGITIQWNHDKIIKAIECIDNIRYTLAGDYDTKYFSEIQKLSGWKKVDYVGCIPHEDVKKLYSKSIAGMAINYCEQDKNEGTLGNTKIFEYMQASLPVICTNYKLWVEIINKYKCGICVDPFNVDEISKAIEYIVNNKEKAYEMGINGLKAVLTEYNWKTQEDKLLELYKKLLKNR